MRNFLSNLYRPVFFIKSFGKEESGSIAVETALIATFLMTLGVGVVDFGLAVERKMDMANAVRAGMQYSLVRKPMLNDLSAIENAVMTTLVTGIRSSDTTISSVLHCKCPDGEVKTCFDPDEVEGACSDDSFRGAYVDLTLTEEFSLMFTYPGVGKSVTLEETASVRLN